MEEKKHCGSEIMNKYYKFSDGWFTYYVNVVTGEKKFSLDKDDVLVESNLDDFCRAIEVNDEYERTYRSGKK